MRNVHRAKSQMKKSFGIIAVMFGLMMIFGLIVSQTAAQALCDPYVDGSTYGAGAEVSNNGTDYTCTVAGWCSIGAAYEPGVGWAWQDAWSEGASCSAPVGDIATEIPDPNSTPEPDSTPDLPAEPSCAAYVDGSSYAAGDTVSNSGSNYTCTVAGWCSTGDAYAPGVGWAWQDAWSAGGSCSTSGGGGDTGGGNQPVAPDSSVNGGDDDGVHIYYFPEWGVYGRDYQVGDIKPLIEAGHVDTIQYSFINVAADGSCEIDDPFVAQEWSKGTNGYTQKGTLAQMAALRDDYLGNVKIVLSLGGWTLSDHFSPIAADSGKLQRMAQSCVQMMEQYRFDGLDIDWEFPGGGGRFDNINTPNHETEDGPNLVKMLQALRDELDAAGTGPDGDPYLLTVALNPGEDKIERLPLADMHPLLDYLSIMAYDLNGAWQAIPAHNAPLYANENDPRVIDNEEYLQNYNVDYAIDMYLAGGVPASKIVLGLAFYGRAWVNVPADSGQIAGLPGLFGTADNGTLDEETGYWCNCEPDYSLMIEPMWNDDGGGLTSDNSNETPGASADGLGSGSWDESVFDYDDVINVLLNQGWTRYWDDESMVPYAYNPDYAGGSLVSYDDVESITIKSKYASDRCLGGIMVWEFTGNSENTDLYDAIKVGKEQSAVNFTSTDENCDNDYVDPDAMPEPTLVPDATPEPTPVPTATPDPRDGDDGAQIYYFPEWGVYGRDYQVGDIKPLIDAGYVNTIQYAFIDLEADGSCKIDDEAVALNWTKGTNGYTQTGTLAQMAALRDDYLGDVKIVLSIGGWTLSDHFSTVAADATKLQKMAQSCVQMMEQYRFDGLDIDWEFPGGSGRFDNVNTPNHETEDGPNFATMLQVLREALDAAGTGPDGDPYLLTAALNPGEEKIARLPLADIHPHLDYLSIMSYDLNGAWQAMPAHNAPLYANPNDPRVVSEETNLQNYNVDYAIDMYLAGGVPPSKIVLGLAFYGRSWVNVPADSGLVSGMPGLFGTADNGTLDEETGYWCNCEPDYSLMGEPMWNDDGGGLTSDNANETPGASADGLGSGSWDESVYDYDDVINVLLNNGWTRYWDDQSMVPYAYNPDYAGGSWVSYDDVESIAIKSKYAMDRCLGGLMVWEFTGNSENSDLYDAIQDGIAQSNYGFNAIDPSCDSVVNPQSTNVSMSTGVVNRSVALLPLLAVMVTLILTSAAVVGRGTERRMIDLFNG